MPLGLTSNSGLETETILLSLKLLSARTLFRFLRSSFTCAVASASEGANGAGEFRNRGIRLRGCCGLCCGTDWISRTVEGLEEGAGWGIQSSDRSSSHGWAAIMIVKCQNPCQNSVELRDVYTLSGSNAPIAACFRRYLDNEAPLSHSKTWKPHFQSFNASSAP